MTGEFWWIDGRDTGRIAQAWLGGLIAVGDRIMLPNGEFTLTKAQWDDRDHVSLTVLKRTDFGKVYVMATVG